MRALTRLSLSDYVTGVRTGDRAVLGRAITLIESTTSKDQALARQLLQALLPQTGQSVRLGITGVPGVGKSTLIDQLGINMIAAGHRVAVLAVDPSSSRSGGSILGDKTRMARLAGDPMGFVRPSPTSGTLGGVALKTREALLVCEAAGFDVVIIETVGVGQSETAVAGMVDFFLVLALPGAGDELQGLKKGVLELADMIGVNKADGDNLARARLAQADYQGALNILMPQITGWKPPVILVSGLENQGLDELWRHIERHRALQEASGEGARRRREQAVRWMQDLIMDRVRAVLFAEPAVARRMHELEDAVRAGRVLPEDAASEIAGLMRITGEQP